MIGRYDLTDWEIWSQWLGDMISVIGRYDLNDDALQVGLLRDTNIRARRTVQEYQDFVKLRRQAEAQYDRAQVLKIKKIN